MYAQYVLIFDFLMLTVDFINVLQLHSGRVQDAIISYNLVSEISGITSDWGCDIASLGIVHAHRIAITRHAYFMLFLIFNVILKIIF